VRTAIAVIVCLAFTARVQSQELIDVKKLEQDVKSIKESLDAIRADLAVIKNGITKKTAGCNCPIGECTCTGKCQCVKLSKEAISAGWEMVDCEFATHKPSGWCYSFYNKEMFRPISTQTGAKPEAPRSETKIWQPSEVGKAAGWVAVSSTWARNTKTGHWWNWEENKLYVPYSETQQYTTQYTYGSCANGACGFSGGFGGGSCAGGRCR
jgi:hypothetical protein